MSNLYWSKAAIIIDKHDYAICYSAYTNRGIKLPIEYYTNLNSVINKKIDEDELLECFALEDREIVKELILNLIEEKILVRSREKEKYNLIEATLLLTDMCNYSCLHCCENAIFFNSSKGHLLDYNDICQIVQKLESLNVKGLLISGGEPTLHPEFKKIVSHIRKIFSGHIAMITNGSMLTDDMADIIINNIDSISISLDGCDKELVQKIRQTDIFDKVKDAVALLHKKGFYNISVSAILPTSYEVEDKFISLCKEWNVNPEIRSFSYTGRGGKNCNTIQKIYDEYIENHGYSKYNQYEKECIGGLNVCGAALRNITIDSKGDVYPCNLLHEQIYKIGNIIDNINLLDDYSSHPVCEKLEKVREFQGTPCQRCEVKNLCWFCISELLTYCSDKEGFDKRCKIKKKNIYRELEALF